jgi:hypothetical protein
MVAMEEEKSTIAQLFGLELLFEILSDPERAAQVRRNYGFDQKCFVALTAAHDVFLLDSRAELERQIATLDSQNASLSHSLGERDARIAALVEEKDVILNSRSWKITAPLRSVRRRIGHSFRGRD